MRKRPAKIRIVTILAGPMLLNGCHVFHANPKIAFLGDSITAGWHYPSVNYGVRGNTTAQMLDRFSGLIPGHGYATVVLLGGTNDVLQKISADSTIHNIEFLAEHSVAAGAEPILCDIPPIFHNFDASDKKDYQPAVVDLNHRINELATAHHWKVVDYYTPLAGHPQYSSDGVHMKRRGYAVMEEALLKQLTL